MSVSLQSDPALQQGYISVDGQRIVTLSPAGGLSATKVNLPNNSVTSEKIVNGAVTEQKLSEIIDQRLARAWCCFSHNAASSTLIVHSSYNIQSITVAPPINNTLVAFVVNFSSAMPNRQYAVVIGKSYRVDSNFNDLAVSTKTLTWERDNVDMPSISTPDFGNNFNSGKSTTQLKLATYYRDGGITSQRRLQLVEGYFAIYAN